MRKFVFILILVFATISFSFKLDFQVRGYLTYDLNSGAIDNFPIAYWTISLPSPLDSFAIKLTDYMTYSHQTFNLFGMNFIVPRYYFVDSRFRLDNSYINTLYIAIGRMRLSRSLTNNYDGVQIGGLKYDTYKTSATELGIGGVVGYVSGKVGNYSYEVGGAYSIELNNYALYGTLKTDFGQFGAYYETRYYQLSLNYQNTQNLPFGTLKYWAGVGSATSTINEPSFLAGATLNSGPIFLAGQFAWIGGNKYDVSFATGEPSNPNQPRSWNVMGEIGYNLPNFYVGLFAKYNSIWAENGWLPLYGVRITSGDFSLSFANGDLYVSSSMPGTQSVLLKVTYNYQASIDLLAGVQGVLSQFAPKVVSTSAQREQTITVADLYKMPEGSKVKVTGTVLAPVGLLSGSTTYIQDKTGAIMLYGRSIPTTLKVGDVVSVTGSTKVYNGILEIVVDSVTVVGNAKVEPVELRELSDKYMSNLVYVIGTVENVAKDNFIVNTGNFKVKVYIKAATGISLANISEGTKVKVTGILTLFKGEYEIQPIQQSDIEAM
ncbi:hypothetical protein [Fervidobacterium islandicum]|uniref:hypothetical protein n=1 Tax=Fervidobacterium islandicum TaxID=2423 RepID=UPI003A741782